MIFEKFSRYWEQKLTIFVDVLLEKTEHTQLRYHTRKSRKLDKTVYGESSMESRQLLMCETNSFYNRLYGLLSFAYALLSFVYVLFSFGYALFSFGYALFLFGYAPFHFVMCSFHSVM